MIASMDKTADRAELEVSMTQYGYSALRIAAITLFFPAISAAQVPVDEAGNVLGQVAVGAEIEAIGDDGIPRLSALELEELVGPVALYPDDLLAIVLPASAYPLQVAAAARFLEERNVDPTLEPDPDWDDSIVALLNYPEVVELLNDDLDWTYRLGEAVVAQQSDVVAAVESFRDRAYTAGNLKSDDYQTVAHEQGAIRISPVAEDVIYVPYYEPARVVHYQPRPVYYYYPRPCPVYYYPYASDYHFNRGYFWGVTTAFTIGWFSDSLFVRHHSYRGHPYYGRHYWDNWYYRRPSIAIYNDYYGGNTRITVNRHANGDRWRARDDRREYVVREGYTRRDNRQVRRTQSVSRDQGVATRQDVVQRRDVRRTGAARNANRSSEREPIEFRKRPQRDVSPPPSARNRSQNGSSESRPRPQFRERDESQRQARPVAKREVRREPPRRESRPAAKREVRREPPRRDVQRDVRPTPERETRRAPPQRESRRAPQRESRPAPQRESRPAPQRSQPSAGSSREKRESSSGRRSGRRDR